MDNVMTMPCTEFVGAVRHHAHFLEDEASRARLRRFRDAIRAEGVRAFLDREYPAGGDKALIVNVTAGRTCLVDGNAHLVALVMCDVGVTLARLVEESGRADFVRRWHDGWEEGSGQEAAYEVYLPLDADTSRIPEAYEGTDWFKDPSQPTKIMPATIAFDSPLFAERDRGRPLGETARRVLERLD